MFQQRLVWDQWKLLELLLCHLGWNLDHLPQYCIIQTQNVLETLSPSEEGVEDELLYVVRPPEPLVRRKQQLKY